MIPARFLLVLTVVSLLLALMIPISYIQKGLSRVAIVGPQLAAAINLPYQPMERADAPARLGGDGDTRFAMIGDYGAVWSNVPSDTAELVHSWQPDFVITVGDNNYPVGAASTIDFNIGRPYHEFIYPYQGEFGEGAEKNRFWPALGNHDWDSLSCVGSRCFGPYFDYFTLPNNERYYDFVEGPIHFFVTDSDTREPDGFTTGSIQGRWLKERLAASTATWKVVYTHHSPYSSGRHGSLPYRQWPYREWGADVVLSGHDHMYERIMVDEMLYLVNGAGGTNLYNFGEPIEGSQVRYNDSHGALLVDANQEQMTFQFITQAGEVIDRHTIQPRESVTPPTGIGELTLPAIADTYGLSSMPFKNYGSEPQLRIGNNPASTAYIKFGLSDLTDMQVVSAKLQLWVANENDAGTRSRPQIRLVDESQWEEGTLTYSNQPVLGQTIGELYTTYSGDFVEVDLTQVVSSSLGSTITIAIDATSTDHLHLHSRESLMRQPSLLIEYNGKGLPPVIEHLSPMQSIANRLHELNVYGQQFQPNSTVTLNNQSLTTQFINAYHLRAVIPATYGARFYQVGVSNPDGTQTAVNHSYTLLGQADDDLYGLPHELTAQPDSFRVGQTNQLALMVHRQGGTERLLDVPVSIYEANQTGPDLFLGVTMVPTLAPNSSASTAPMPWTPVKLGETAIYGQIDPIHDITELFENNNRITRTLTVLPESTTQTQPTLGTFTIDGGLMDTFDPLVELKVELSSKKGQIQSIFVTEFEYNQATRDWLPAHSSGWLPYTDTEPTLYWQLQPTEGVKSLQVWVTDRANNISADKSARISYLPPVSTLARDRSHFYAYHLTANDIMTATLTPNSGDPDLYIWSPSEDTSWQSLNPANTNEQIAFTAPETGPYIIQVHGKEAATYHLDVDITPKNTRSTPQRAPHQRLGDKTPLTEAGLLPNELPDTLPYALPTDAHFSQVYLPALVR